MRRKCCLLTLALAPLLLGGALLTAQTAATADDFSYNGDLGPGFWSKIAPACATTPVSRQSPIDIDRTIEDPGLEPLHVVVPETSYKLSNKGYTVEAGPKDAGFLLLHETVYKLLQFHFHTLSEHTVEGRRGEMELHAVFRNELNHADLAVIGVLFKIGSPNPFLDKIIAAGVPQLTGTVGGEVKGLRLHEVFADIASYYTYSGSLTTPKCSEGVTWVVLKQWAEMSPEEFEAFRHVLGNDFRPLQARNGREIRATVK